MRILSAPQYLINALSIKLLELVNTANVAFFTRAQ